MAGWPPIAAALLALLSMSTAEEKPRTSRNLLRNTSFTQCTTPGLPDYWGSLRIAEQWNDIWKPDFYTTDADSPVPGTRSLRITVPEGKQGMEVISYYHWLPWRREYTFSCYMRADEDGHAASMYVGSQFPVKPEYRVLKTFTVGTQWQRYSVSGLVQQGHWFGGIWSFMTASFSSKQPGTLWVAAPQLEFGPEAATYAPAAADAGPPSIPAVPAAHATTPPRIDGVLDDECWRADPPVSSFKRVGEAIPVDPAAGTSVWLRYDNRNVYVAFRCQDPEAGKPVPRAAPGTGEAAMHGYDCVEVFLKPDVEATEYLAFGVTREGLRCDVKEYWYGWDSSDWLCGAAETQGGWAAEFAIPFHLFASQWMAPPFGENLGVNLFRSRLPAGAGTGSWKMGMEAEMSVWFDSPDRAVRRPGAFGRVTGIDLGKVQVCHVSDIRLIGSGISGLDAVVEAGHVPATGEAGTLQVEVMPPDMDRAYRVDVPFTLDGRPRTARIPLAGLGRKPGNYLLNAFVFDADRHTIGRVRRKFLMPANLALPGSDLEAVIERSYYTSEPFARLLIRSDLDVPVRVRAEGLAPKDRDKFDFGGDHALEPRGKQILTARIEHLEVGRYWIAVDALDAAGRRVATATDQIVKHPPATREVKTDHFRRMILVNGAPFIAYAGGRQGPCVAGNAKTPTAEGQKLLAWMDAASPEAGAEMFKQLTQDDRIIAYKYRDECWDTALLRRLYERIRPVSPYLLVYNNFGEWTHESVYEGPGGTIDCTDVVCQCQYPFGTAMGYGNVGERRPYSFASLLDYLSRARRAAILHRKIIGLWLPTYGCDDAYRCPTPDEARCMTYLAFIHGARIFKYFMGRPISNPLWESLAPLGKEMETLAEIVGDPDAEEIHQSQQGDVYSVLWRSKGALYLIAANAWKDPVTFTYDLPEAGQAAEALFNRKGAVTVEGRRITGRLSAFESIVCRIAP
jgi:hypothetical protein